MNNIDAIFAILFLPLLIILSDAEQKKIFSGDWEIPLILIFYALVSIILSEYIKSKLD